VLASPSVLTKLGCGRDAGSRNPDKSVADHEEKWKKYESRASARNVTPTNREEVIRRLVLPLGIDTSDHGEIRCVRAQGHMVNLMVANEA